PFEHTRPESFAIEEPPHQLISRAADYHRTRFRQFLEARGSIRRIADDRITLPKLAATHLAYYHEARVDPEPNIQGDGRLNGAGALGVQPAHRGDDAESGAYRSLRVIFACVGIPKIS